MDGFARKRVGAGRAERGTLAKSSIIPSPVLACFAAKTASEFASRKKNVTNAHDQLAIACVVFAHMDEKMGVGARPPRDVCRRNTLLRRTLSRLGDWEVALVRVLLLREGEVVKKQSTHKEPSQ